MCSWNHKLLESIGWSSPGDLSIDDIALSLNAYVKESKLEGSQGRILIKGETAIITVNSYIDYIPKRNFVVAHEIGHLILHNNLSSFFSDTDKTLNEWYANGKHEIEANNFASELLMPTNLFKLKTGGQKISLELISELSNFFGTSLTATLLKYTELGDFSTSIIYAENGLIKWKKESTDFPLKFISIGSKIREGSSAYDFFKYGELENDSVPVDAIDWFPEDFNIEDNLDLELWEHNFRVGTNGLLTFLWVG